MEELDRRVNGPHHDKIASECGGGGMCREHVAQRERGSTEEMKISEKTRQGKVEETYISGSKGFVPNIRLSFTALCKRSKGRISMAPKVL